MKDQCEECGNELVFSGHYPIESLGGPDVYENYECPVCASQDKNKYLTSILRDIHQQVDLKTLPSSIAVRIEALFGLVQDHGDPCQKNRT